MSSVVQGQPSASDAKDIIDAVERLSAPVVVKDAHPILAGDLMVISKGQQIQDLRPFIDARLSNPRRKEGTSTHSTLESFIAHTLRFRDADSAIFATQEQLTTVFDYNCAGAGAPRFGKHRSVYAFPFSKEWRAWEGVFAGKLSQAEFASFLEDHLADVTELGAISEGTASTLARIGLDVAGSTTLLTLSRGISMRAETRVKQVVNLSTGESQMHFEETHADEGGGRLKIPGGFVLTIPVFTEGAAYQIPVRIRYRVTNGNVSWSFAPHRVDAVLRDAFNEVCETVAQRTGLPLFHGTPER